MNVATIVPSHFDSWNLKQEKHCQGWATTGTYMAPTFNHNEIGDSLVFLHCLFSNRVDHIDLENLHFKIDVDHLYATH